MDMIRRRSPLALINFTLIRESSHFVRVQSGQSSITPLSPPAPAQRPEPGHLVELASDSDSLAAAIPATEEPPLR